MTATKRVKTTLKTFRVVLELSDKSTLPSSSKLIAAAPLWFG